jgi:RNA polymerase sigma-70 factor (ECF subfamily)
VEEQQAIRSFLSSPTDESFCALFTTIYPRVRSYFLARHLDELTAEDLAQAVLFKVYQKSSELKDPALFYGWLFAVARNELLQHWRQQQARIKTVEPGPLADIFMTEPDKLSQLQFMEWLSLLEPNERELVLLRFGEGLTYEELATALDIPLGTVESRLFALRKKLLRIAEAGQQHLKSGSTPRGDSKKQG